jgi:hypothetical protein
MLILRGWFMRDDRDVWHLNGVRSGNDSATLPDSIGLEKNVLGVPIFVLNSKTASSQHELVYEWRTRDDRDAKFKFVRDPNVPFPQSQHVVYFDALLAMFANNFREDGYVYFRVSDVLRYVGKSRTSGSYEAVKETIYRYAYCTAHWHESWVTARGEAKGENWHGPLIIVDDIWVEKTHEVTDDLRLKKNPRNARKAENWHRIRFHPEIVNSIKNGFTKIFLTKVLGLGVSADAQCVYRYFYGFSDSSEIRRSVEHLMSAFAWQGGRAARFEAWLRTQLNELVAHDLVDVFEIENEWVTVRCVGLKALRDNLLPPPSSAPAPKRRKAATKRAAPEPSDQALVEHYFNLKAAGKVEQSVAETIDVCLAKGSKDVYIPVLKSYFAKVRM